MDVKRFLSFKKMHEQFLLQQLKLGSHPGKFDGNSRVPQVLAMHLSWRKWRQHSWDSRRRFPHLALSRAWGSPCSQIHPASLDLGCPQHGQLYCLRNGIDVWDLGGFKLSLSSRCSEKAVFQVAQTNFGNPFQILASCDQGEIFHWFSDLSYEGVPDAVSTAPYRTGCLNSRKELLFKGMERK